MNADDILNTLADLLADRVAARLSARPAIYSSTALPPGITRRTFHARCRTIPEAVRDGRVWRCPVGVLATSRSFRTSNLGDRRAHPRELRVVRHERQ